MRIRMIINPTAGRQVFQQKVEKIIDRLLKEHLVDHVDTIRTQASGDAYQAARHFRPWETDLVLAVGGDGTVNEVVNGMLDGAHKTPLAILAAGTVNDFANALRLPRDPGSFCDMVRHFRTLAIDVGKANDRFFLNVAAGGMLTDVAYKVPSEAKTVLGRMAYLLSGAKDLQEQRFKPIHVRLESAQKRIEEEVQLFIVANSSSVGGFRNLAPQASVQDGLLDVLVVHKQNILELVPVFMQMVNGDHIKNSRITYFQTDRLSIECASGDDDISLDLDGEHGGHLPAVIEMHAGRLQLLVP